MNAKVLVAFLGGLLAATSVYYVQSHRNAKVAAETAVAVTQRSSLPPATPVPGAPAPGTKPVPAAKSAPPKAPAKTTVVLPELPAPVPPVLPTEQAEISAPTVPEPPAPAPARPAVEPKPEPAQPRSVTLAAGTLVAVRLNESISTERNQTGDAFTATLDQPLVVDGLVIAEKGSRAGGRVVDAVEAGRVKGLAHLSLELTSLMTSDGQQLEFQTARFAKEGPASKTEDVKKVGIGAAIGAAIGAIAGGGKGAAIGAATGGVAGGGVAAATRGKPAVLPAETKISFRIDQPVTITERR